MPPSSTSEGLTDFQRVLDSQRTLFSQQETLVTSRGNLAQSLIALYKAMGGGWEQGRSRPVLDDATRETMGRRSDWKGLLDVPAAGARRRRICHTASRSGKTMSQEPAREPAKQPPAPVQPSHRRRLRRPSPARVPGVGAIVVLVLIIASLLWYFVADRLTPYTSQARVQAFVVPVAAEVSGAGAEGVRQEQR